MNASNSRNEGNNSTANTAGTTAKAGMLAKVVKPATACRETNYSRDTINIREDSKSRNNLHIMKVSRRRTVRTRQYESMQHSAGTPATAAEVTTITVGWTAAETIGTSQTSTA
jgi:hypothetical protein